MVLPLLRRDALPHEGINVVLDIWQENLQSSQRPFCKLSSAAHAVYKRYTYQYAKGSSLLSRKGQCCRRHPDLTEWGSRLKLRRGIMSPSPLSKSMTSRWYLGRSSYSFSASLRASEKTIRTVKSLARLKILVWYYLWIQSNKKSPGALANGEVAGAHVQYRLSSLHWARSGLQMHALRKINTNHQITGNNTRYSIAEPRVSQLVYNNIY